MAAPMALQIRRGDPGAFSRGVRTMQEQQANALRAAAGKRAEVAMQREEEKRNMLQQIGGDLMGSDPEAQKNALGILAQYDLPMAQRMRHDIATNAMAQKREDRQELKHEWEKADRNRKELDDERKLKDHEIKVGKAQFEDDKQEAQIFSMLAYDKTIKDKEDLLRLMSKNPAFEVEDVEEFANNIQTEQQFNDMVQNAYAMSFAGQKEDRKVSPISRMLNEQAYWMAQPDSDEKTKRLAALKAAIEKAVHIREALTPWSRGETAVYKETGAYIGPTAFNRADKSRTLPDGSAFNPETMILVDSAGAYSANDWGEWALRVSSAETAIKSFVRHMKDVDSLEQGWKLAADSLWLRMKTIFGDRTLTDDEMRQLRATGEIHGKIGKSRLTMMGPGPVTEFDAARIIAGLGGNIGLLKNIPATIELLKQFTAEKVKDYNEVLVPQYNFQRTVRFRGPGFHAKTEIDLNKELGGIGDRSGQEEAGNKEQFALPDDPNKRQEAWAAWVAKGGGKPGDQFMKDGVLVTIPQPGLTP